MRPVGLLVLFVAAVTVVSAHTQTYAPGRVIVKLSPLAASRLLADGTTGIPKVDDVLKDLDILSIRRRLLADI